MGKKQFVSGLLTNQIIMDSPLRDMETEKQDCECEQFPCSYDGKTWEEELSEYGQIHNKDCCVHFPEDSRACDVGTGFDDCCENIRGIAEFVRKEKEKSRQEENKRWIEMAEAHRPYCSAAGNKMLTRMMGKKNRNLNNSI